MSDAQDRLGDLHRELHVRADARRTELSRERDRRNHVLQLEQLKREVEECGSLVHKSTLPLHRLYPDFHDNWDLEAESYGDGKPLERQWPKINRIVCKVWVRRWARVAWLIQLKELEDVVRCEQPDDPLDALVHSLFTRVLGAPDWRGCRARARSIAAELAVLRADLARTAPPELPDVHYELSLYFSRWLWPRLEAALRRAADRVGAPLRPHIAKARASLEWAATVRPDLGDDRGELYAHIKHSGDCPAYQGGRVPAFQTWLRYLREAIAETIPGPAADFSPEIRTP